MPKNPLQKALLSYALERSDALVRRFAPGFEMPGFMTGYRGRAAERADLAYLLAQLAAHGLKELAGFPIEEGVGQLLCTIDGKATETFYSFRVAETLLAFGGLEKNVLNLSQAEIENLREAVDSTHIYDRAKRSLRGWNNNYWAVLAVCEFRRQQLGLLTDTTVLEAAVEGTRAHLSANPLGFFDDSPDLRGRYDSYSADVQLFIEPIRHLFDPKLVRENLRRHVRLLETIALENGASVGWGRSIGPLSICLTMELGAVALRDGLASDRARMFGLVQHAFEQFKSWIDDDLINAHRGCMTEEYRGVHRLLQMTIDCLAKLCFTAHTLEDVQAEPQSSDLFPEIDTYIPFETERHAGVWMVRNKVLTFQLPFVSGFNADYAAWLHSPGLFENPVEGAFGCGVPHLSWQGHEYFPMHLPSSLEVQPGKVRAVFEEFCAVRSKDGTPPFQGRRETAIQLAGDTVTGSEHWIFQETPDAIVFQIPESTRRLILEIETEAGYQQSIVTVDGMSQWRSCWNQLTRLHQVNFRPARVIRFTWRLRPALNVALQPAKHDYIRALYAGARAGEIVPNPLDSPLWPNEMHLERLVGRSEILHLNWPEHLFRSHGMERDRFDEQYLRLIEEIGKASVRVVWTMHNRRPHGADWRGERGDRLYRAWAAIADGVIHHSEVGKQLMLADLPYRPGALHTIIPHGHYGEQMRVAQTRAELESQFYLPPAAMRFGVLGRAQKEKQVEMIARAFMQAARPDQQLLITAHPIDLDVSGDPRIILLPREGWLDRETIAMQVHLCDALVSAHAGETYLTSGTIADSIGAGIPMIANEWAFFREMLGDSAIYHQNTEESLAKIFANLSPGELDQRKQLTCALQPRFAWLAVAQQMVEFFREVRMA